jgi:hypothetical protein
MSKLNKPFKFILPLLFLFPFGMFAQTHKNSNSNSNKSKYEVEKTKSTTKTYAVSPTDILNIKNSFGAVEVHTWNKNEIKVDVNVEVSANTNELAQRVLDKILLSDEKNGKTIYFKTTINNINNQKGEKSSMEVNYAIYMPAGNPLVIKNEFGATKVPNHSGEVELTSKFGSLTTGNLTNIKSLNVEFGSADFQNLSGGNISIKYSKANFEKLSGNVRMDLQFCNPVKINLHNTLTGLDLKASYTSVNLLPSNGLSASYDISTSFGSLKNRSNVKFDGGEDDNKSHGKFNHTYSGKSGSGNAKIKVKSNFGDVIIGQPAAGDIKEKKKSKTSSTT